jgi:DNA-binding response OmpR family regulator
MTRVNAEGDEWARGFIPLSPRVLLLHTDQVVASSLQILLRSRGIQAVTLIDWSEIEVVVHSFRPTLAFVDASIRNVNFRDSAIRIREIAPSITLVALTNGPLSQTHGELLREGYDWSIPRPASLQQLLDLIFRQ